MSNRRDRRKLESLHRKERKAAIKAVRGVKNQKHRTEYALSFSRRLADLYPFFNTTSFLRACGIIMNPTGLLNVDETTAPSPTSETPA